MAGKFHRFHFDKLQPRSPANAGRNLALLIVAAIALVAGGYYWATREHRPTTTGAPAVATSVPAAAHAAVAAPIPAKSVAVLPFDNLSRDPADAYLADGLQEEILNALARLRDMKVISRTSVQAFRGHGQSVREIGQRLGVRTVLEGSVRREGKTLRLTVQLIDARDDHHLLATNYDRKLDDILGLQTAVAKQVADALSATLSSVERGDLDRVATNNGDAYDRYLHAAALFRQPAAGDVDGLIEPRRLLLEAVKIDPDYAEAWASLAQVETWIYFQDGLDAGHARSARVALDRALALDANLPDCIMARGLYANYIGHDLDQAIQDLGAVVAVRPNSAEAQQLLGLALRRRGAMNEALPHLERAWDLDPLNHVRDSGPIITLLGLRRYPEAIEQTEIDTSRWPNLADSYFARARLQDRIQGSLDPLRAALRDHGGLLEPTDRLAVEAELAQAEGRYLDSVRLWRQVPSNNPVARGKRIGLLYLAAGEPELARQEFLAAERSGLKRKSTSEESNDLVDLALVQSLLGEHAQALATIEQARSVFPEKYDAVNGPQVSFARSIILARAGRLDEAHAEANRLLKVPFGAPFNDFFGSMETWELFPEAKDPRFDALINHPPRL